MTAFFVVLPQIIEKMERVRLTRDEKKIMRHIYHHYDGKPKGIDEISLGEARSSLQDKNMLKSVSLCDTEIPDWVLTDKGRAYIRKYPCLFSPFDWKSLLIILFTGLTAAAAIAALFVS